LRFWRFSFECALIFGATPQSICIEDAKKLPLGRVSLPVHAVKELER